MRELDHPNIIKLYETWETERICFLVTEYCAGGELFYHIVKKEKKQLPKLVDRIEAIAKKARAQQKKEALAKIKKEYRNKKKECKKVIIEYGYDNIII